MVKNLVIFSAQNLALIYLNHVLPGASCRVNHSQMSIEYTDGSITHVRVLRTDEDLDKIRGVQYDNIVFDTSFGKVDSSVVNALSHQLVRNAQLSPADAAPFLQAHPLSR